MEPQRKTGFVYSPLYLRHLTKAHPERPERLSSIIQYLDEEDILDRLELIEPYPATAAQIALIHEPSYINSIEEAYGKGVRFLDADTQISYESYRAALLAAGGALAGVDAVLDGRVENVFCAVRPPGHHALRNRAMGFCLFNNVAIAAQYAKESYGLSRIFIVDWDDHHGNGTSEAFEADPSVFYFSIHEYPHYPGTGLKSDKGRGAGKGYTKNFPLHAGAGDKEYIAAFQEELLPEISHFQPELILISAGFDAHQDDTLSGMQLTAQGFGKLTRLVCRAAQQSCGGRIVSILEGGYDLSALAQSVAEHLTQLLESSNYPNNSGS